MLSALALPRKTPKTVSRIFCYVKSLCMPICMLLCTYSRLSPIFFCFCRVLLWCTLYDISVWFLLLHFQCFFLSFYFPFLIWFVLVTLQFAQRFFFCYCCCAMYAPDVRWKKKHERIMPLHCYYCYYDDDRSLSLCRAKHQKQWIKRAVFRIKA